MDDTIYHYVVNLPPKINEMVTPCADGYTVYISDRLDHEGQLRAYAHALEHIKNNDFASEEDIQSIEAKAHKQTTEKPAQPKIRKKKKLSQWEKYHRKQQRKEKALAKMGLMRESYLDDDEYGCPTVKYRVIKRRW